MQVMEMRERKKTNKAHEKQDVKQQRHYVADGKIDCGTFCSFEVKQPPLLLKIFLRVSGRHADGRGNAHKIDSRYVLSH